MVMLLLNLWCTMSKKNRIANVSAPVTAPVTPTNEAPVPSANGTHTTVETQSTPTTIPVIENGLGDGGSVNDTSTTTPPISVVNTNGTGGFNLTQAVRNALSELGLEATSTDVMLYITDHYGSETAQTINKGTFSNTLSVTRSKMRNGDTGPSRGSTSTHTPTVEFPAVVSLCQTLNTNLSGLEDILTAIEDTGSITGIRNAINKAKEMLALAEQMKSLTTNLK